MFSLKPFLSLRVARARYYYGSITLRGDQSAVAPHLPGSRLRTAWFALHFSMNSQNKETIIAKDDHFEAEEEPALKIRLRDEVLGILNSLFAPDSDDFHIWGLTYYMSDDNKDYHRKLALQMFQKAYQLDNSNFLACLYIAHCYHDNKQLKSALKYYELVNRQALLEWQPWRYVKLLEQIGYCHYKLGNTDRGRTYFQDVLEWFRKLPSEDIVPPGDLLDCLPDTDEIVIEIRRIEEAYYH